MQNFLKSKSFLSRNQKIFSKKRFWYTNTKQYSKTLEILSRCIIIRGTWSPGHGGYITGGGYYFDTFSNSKHPPKIHIFAWLLNFGHWHLFDADIASNTSHFCQKTRFLEENWFLVWFSAQQGVCYLIYYLGSRIPEPRRMGGSLLVGGSLSVGGGGILLWGVTTK